MITSFYHILISDKSYTAFGRSKRVNVLIFNLNPFMHQSFVSTAPPPMGMAEIVTFHF